VYKKLCLRLESQINLEVSQTEDSILNLLLISDLEILSLGLVSITVDMPRSHEFVKQLELVPK
jgi:hypothetical protein